VTYRAPLADIGFALKHGAALSAALDEGLFGDLTMDVVEAVLAEAGRLAGEVIAPLNRIGDTFGTPFKDGVVTTAPGWKEAYKTWRDGGWNGLAAPVEWGGQALPQSINIACIEMWNAAAMAFAVGPLLTIAAIDALHATAATSSSAFTWRKW
jgi:alkylation response protein AidB-like acyl-CoA dehydrogenase